MFCKQLKSKREISTKLFSGLGSELTLYKASSLQFRKPSTFFQLVVSIQRRKQDVLQKMSKCFS